MFSFSLLPWMIAESIYDLTGESLHRAGISLLLADLDNTLVPYGVPLPDEKLKAWRDDLAARRGDAVRFVQQSP